MKTKTRKIGELIKAIRHGYCWSIKYDLYIRIHPMGADTTFQIDICPEEAIAQHLDERIRRGDPHYHIVWWELPRGGNEIFDCIPALQHSNFSTPITLRINTAGQLVTP